MSVLDPPAAGHGARRRTVSVLLRLRVVLRRRRLDRLLADGRSPATDPRLALRATQLARLPLRADLASALRDAMRCSNETALTRRRSPQAPVALASVRECAEELCALARALTDVNPRIRGVAITSQMLTDGLGPLYTPGQTEQLRTILLSARSAL